MRDSSDRCAERGAIRPLTGQRRPSPPSRMIGPPATTPDPHERLKNMTYRPHPIPYQGSKRVLAERILALVTGQKVRKLYEPFAGSAAITIAASRWGVADSFIISDSCRPLVGIWDLVLSQPADLARGYERIWTAQLQGCDGYYDRIRSAFNDDGDPVKLLYLLARCVKNSPRFNQDGGFNQSADRRRLGMRPSKMRSEILNASQLLRDRTVARCCDFEDILSEATRADLVYLDPPWEGTTNGPHKRYQSGLPRERLLQALRVLLKKRVRFLLSYDGRCGTKTYGEELPDELGLRRVELVVGRSAQATLNGRADVTVESLYLSPELPEVPTASRRGTQLTLWSHESAPA